jgi:hypothetical protein
MSRPCCIKNCPNTVSDKSQFPECKGCRNVYRYWWKLPTERVVTRQEQLVKWADRMARMIDYPKGKRYERVIRGFTIGRSRGNSNT